MSVDLQQNRDVAPGASVNGISDLRLPVQSHLSMIIRWISLVPSKMVKILAIREVSAGQRLAVPHGISTDSARPVRDDFRFRSAPCAIGMPGGRMRSRLRTRAARKLEGALCVAVFAGQIMQIHPVVSVRGGYTGVDVPVALDRADGIGRVVLDADRQVVGFFMQWKEAAP